jgi:alpha-1,2-mannosyltransferase
LRRLSELANRYAAGLSVDRLRMHSIVLAAGAWITAAYTLATTGVLDRNGILKGIDFLQFYTAGRIVAQDGTERLYDWNAFVGVLHQAVPAAGDVLFVSVYPPQLAALFAPLGRLSYVTALIVWTIASVLLYAVCVRAMARRLPEVRRARLGWPVLALAFVPFQQLLLHGQIGMLVLVCVAAGWLALRSGRWWAVGVALGSLCFKPTFLIAAVVAAAASRNVRLAAGVATGIAVQVAAVTLLFGPGVWRDYRDTVLVLLQSPEAFEPKPWQMHNLKGFWRLLLGESRVVMWLWLACVPPVLLAVDFVWRRTGSADVRFATVIIATVLLNPHLYVYDLIVLSVVFAALSRWLLDAPRARATEFRVLLHLLWWVPLVGPFAMLTHVQLTPIVLTALLWQLVCSVRASGVPAPSTLPIRTS